MKIARMDRATSEKEEAEALAKDAHCSRNQAYVSSQAVRGWSQDEISHNNAGTCMYGREQLGQPTYLSFRRFR